MSTRPAKSNDPSAENRSAEKTRRPWSRLPLLLALVLIIILLYKWRGAPHEANLSTVPAPGAPAGTQASKTVTLTVDFNDGHAPQANKFAWTNAMTVRDLWNASPGHSISQQGTGATAFLASIDGVKNEGSGGKNWMYWVNGRRADRSFAVYELQPGDHVLWRFTPPQ